MPVDWVSAAITEIVCNRLLYEETYHLTARNRVTARMMQDVLENIIGIRNTVFCGAATKLDNPTLVERLFYEHLQTYHSYWRDDPVFDLTNTTTALPHLPCPEIDSSRLMMLARRAIELNFRWNDPPVRELNQVSA